MYSRDGRRATSGGRAAEHQQRRAPVPVVPAQPAAAGAVGAALGQMVGGVLGLGVGARACWELSVRIADSTVPEPDLCEVPASPRFSTAWLTAALRRSGVLPASLAVSEAAVGEIKLEVEGGDALLNGGGFAGGKTVRVSGIAYEQAAEGEGATASATASLPRSCIQKWCSSVDILPGTGKETRPLCHVILK